MSYETVLQTEIPESAAVNSPEHVSGFAWLDIAVTLMKARRRIFLITVMAMLLAGLVSLFLKNNYQSSALILPPRQDQSVSGLLSGQLGSLAALSGGAGLSSAALSLKSPNEIYSGLLLSRTVSTDLINKFDLMHYFHKKRMEDAIKALDDHTQIDLAKSNLIRITVTTHDPVFSSQIANAYVDELHTLNTSLALTDASQRRAFYQQQLDQEKLLLTKAEGNLQETQRKTGLLQPTGQADLVSRNIATIRAEITSRSAQLRSLGTFATDQNPDYQRLRSEIGSLQAQLTALENSDKVVNPGDIEVPTSRLPAAALEYTRNLREVKLHEAVYELLIKQYEAARIDEAKTAPLIQVVDRAVPAEKKSGPLRSLIIIGSGILAALFTVTWYIARYMWNIFRRDERFGPSLARLTR